MSVIPRRRSAIAIVSRGSERRATLPVYAWDSQKMSSGCFIAAMSWVTLSFRHRMPVAYVV